MYKVYARGIKVSDQRGRAISYNWLYQVITIESFHSIEAYRVCPANWVMT